MMNIDFRHIAAKDGDQRAAFEELCCQLARRTVSSDTTFVRLHGAGGDGGVECIADFADGSRIGWQAKYVFNIDSLLNQATESLTVALRTHPTLSQFILCFPFDLTGETGRRGRSGFQKLANWRKQQMRVAAAQGRVLEIHDWPASKLRSLLMELDVSGGIRRYFFDEIVLSSEWFASHLNTARSIAGPRYTPELNVRTTVGEWFAALGRIPNWHRELENRLTAARRKHDRLRESIVRSSGDSTWPVWPHVIFDEAISASNQITDALNVCEGLKYTSSDTPYWDALERLEDVLRALSSVESALVEEIEEQHGPGRADSPGFRQFMAEYQVSFPTANLDSVRETVDGLKYLRDWLRSPSGALAFRPALVLSGGWGVGKTHGICDVAFQRLEKNLLSCIVFGHQFGGEPDPWTRLIESLGLPATFGKDALLDSMNAAAEASGHILILFVDAINETRPAQYWRYRLNPIVEEIHRRPYLRICFTCRTPYLTHCLPESHVLDIVEHPGFKSIEQLACTAFFKHYGLRPPVAPILQPELGNPLYLRLVCDTLKSRGLDQLPSGWSSVARVVAAFLEEKEKEFARDKNVSPNARIVSTSLRSIARSIADSGDSKLAWSEASRVVLYRRPEAITFNLVEWLVGANLLIEEPSDSQHGFPEESTVRLAFERLGDFLIASELLTQISESTLLRNAFHPGGQLHVWIKDESRIEENYGILSALSIMIPERDLGTELPDLVPEELRGLIGLITLRAIPWRDPGSFSSSTRTLLLESLSSSKLNQIVLDSLLSVSWRPSNIDATWLHGVLRRIPLARRDAYWCWYLHHSYEQTGPAMRLIDAAFDLPLEVLEPQVAARWAIALIWFTAAADRRLKDHATRALIKLLAACPTVIPELLDRFLYTDDDEIRERFLLTVYGALIISRDSKMIAVVAKALRKGFRRNPREFDNALIRDHIRCITELAIELGLLSNRSDPQLTTRSIGSTWPLEIPTDDQVDKWGQLLRFRPNEFFSDFFKYTLNCLSPWRHVFSKEEMGKWILQRVARDFGYQGSGCENYDKYMLATYGGGRAKPVWAEQIAKKYKWVAMYQLASRLHDHVERERSRWKPKLLRTPLILLEERKLDPTFPAKHAGEIESEPWWIPASVDIGQATQFTDEEWVRREDDMPTLEGLISPFERNGQHWRLLVGYPEWSGKSDDADRDEPYRHAWLHLESYLVEKKDFNIAFDCLHRRNYFGQWLPQGASWLYGFVGEYPWATAFNTEPDGWYGSGESVNGLPVALRPTWNEIAVEWEYDASLAKNHYMLVPARTIFPTSNLWWDGTGYRQVNGRTVSEILRSVKPGPSHSWQIQMSLLKFSIN